MCYESSRRNLAALTMLHLKSPVNSGGHRESLRFVSLVNMREAFGVIAKPNILLMYKSEKFKKIYYTFEPNLKCTVYSWIR